MKKIVFSIALVIVMYLVVGFFFPIIPVRLPAGYHGLSGEFCGVVYTPDCDELVPRRITLYEFYYLHKFGMLKW